MKDALIWLLDLQHVKLDDPSRLTLQWLRPLDGWMWFVIGVAVLLYVGTLYRRETAGLRVRVLMAACRCAVILLGVVLLCEPALVHRQDRIEPSTLAIMIDDSASMAQSDHYSAGEWPALAELLPQSSATGSVRHCSRWQLVQALLGHEDHSLIRELLQRHELRFFRFAGAVSQETHLVDADNANDTVQRMTARKPSGLSTNLSEAIRQVFESCIDAHLAGVVVITDGQPTQQGDWERVVQLSTARDTPLFPVVTGSVEPPRDLTLRRADMPKHVYVGDKVGCDFSVQAAGLPPGTPFEVVIRDRRDDTVVGSGSFVTRDDGPIEDEIQLDPRPEGRHELIVEVRPVEGEIGLQNNSRQLQLYVVEDRARVMLVEGYPRYEYRYLKNTLLRENSVILSTLLLSADEQFIQEGDQPIRRFPVVEEELDEYDVILLGDVDPTTNWISNSQLQMVNTFVTRNGGGLGFLAGERFCPQKFYGTPLETLVPVELSGHINEHLTPQTLAAFKPQLTAAGRESPLLRLLIDQSDRDTLFSRLPSWFWASPVRGPRPGAEVLLEHPSLVRREQHLPVVVLKRHGAGTVFYQGSDDSWRWRRHRGEALFDAYWLQVVRVLAQQKQFPVPQGIILRPSRNMVDPQDTVTLALIVEDPDVAGQLPDDVTVQIQQADFGTVDSVTLRRLAAGSQHFQGTFQPQGIGQFEARFDPAGFAIDQPVVRTLLEVKPQWLEHREPQANRALMDQLAERTAGRVFEPHTAAALGDVIPTKEFTVPNDLTETVWDSKLTLLLFVLLIVTEWLLRKRRGLT